MSLEGPKASSYVPKQQHVQELRDLFYQFETVPEHPWQHVKKIATKIREAQGHIPDHKFIKYLQKAVFLTRKGMDGCQQRCHLCCHYVKENPGSTLPFLLAEIDQEKLDLAKFRELLPLLNQLLLQAFRKYETAKKEMEAAPKTLVRHLTFDHKGDPCTVCDSLASSLPHRVDKKKNYVGVMQHYIAFFLNHCENKLMQDPMLFGAGMIAGALIGDLVAQDAFGLKQVPWTVHSEFVRSHSIRRSVNLPPLGEVEITFGKNDSETYLFNMAEDGRMDGQSLFSLRKKLLEKLNQKKLPPLGCSYILTTLKTTLLGEVKGFFGRSYEPFFADIEERCEQEVQASKHSQTVNQEKAGSPCKDFVLTHQCEHIILGQYERHQKSLQSMAAIQGGKYGFDPIAATFVPSNDGLGNWLAATLAWGARQSSDSVAKGIHAVQFDHVSLLRAIACQVEESPEKLAAWEQKLPLLQAQVKAAIEGLERLDKSNQQIKLAKHDFETVVNRVLKEFGDKISQLKSKPPSKPLSRPLSVLTLFVPITSPEQEQFYASYSANLEKEKRYIEANRPRLYANEDYLVHKGSALGIPWSFAVTPQKRTMLHYHLSSCEKGKAQGSALKKYKYGLDLATGIHLAKLTSKFNFAALMGSAKWDFSVAKNEQFFLGMINQAPHPNVVETYEVCWRYKEESSETFLIQTIYQRCGQKGNLGTAWTSIIDDDQAVEKILKGLLSGLAHLHNLGIVVNDIKLTNIVLDANGNPIYIDFGVSRMQGAENVKGGTTIYTDLNVLKAQQIEGQRPKAEFSRDLWSLGIIFYFLLFKTTKLPWMTEFTSIQEFEAIVEKKAQLFPKPPQEAFWLYACWTMLSLESEARPQATTLCEQLLDKPYLGKRKMN